MKITVPVNIGNSTYTVEAEVKTLMDIAKGELAFYQSLPKRCTNCDGGDLMLNHREAKGFNFYGLKCTTCGAELKFGQKKDGTGFFVKRDQTFEKFSGNFNQDKEEKPFNPEE